MTRFKQLLLWQCGVSSVHDQIKGSSKDIDQKEWPVAFEGISLSTASAACQSHDQTHTYGQCIDQEQPHRALNLSRISQCWCLHVTCQHIRNTCQHRDQTVRALNVIRDIPLHVWHVMTRLSGVNACISYCHTLLHSQYIFSLIIFPLMSTLGRIYLNLETSAQEPLTCLCSLHVWDFMTNLFSGSKNQLVLVCQCFAKLEFCCKNQNIKNKRDESFYEKSFCCLCLIWLTLSQFLSDSFSLN